MVPALLRAVRASRAALCGGARADARAVEHEGRALLGGGGCGWLFCVDFVVGMFWFVVGCLGVVVVVAMGMAANLQGSWCRGRTADPLSPGSVKQCDSSACPCVLGDGWGHGSGVPPDAFLGGLWGV